MTLATILDRAGDSLGGYLPRLGGALLLLFVGLLCAALIRRALTKVLQAAKVDELGERWGVHEILEGLGLERSLSVLIARAVRIAIVVVVLFAALSLLGLEFLSDSLNAVILFLPRVFVALAQLGIPTQVLMLLAAILLGAVALTLALAFGIGGRDTAREVSARRYVEGAFAIGEDISVAGERGRITAIEATGTVLETTDGTRVRVPNSQLVASVVTLHQRP